MNPRRASIVFCAAILVLASVCWIAPLYRSSRAAPAPAADGNFKGKKLLVHSQAWGVYAVEEAHLRKLGDHSWLMGKGIGGNSSLAWQKGKTISIQMEHIVSISEFDNLKDLKTALESGGDSILPVVRPALPVPEDATPPASEPLVPKEKQ